MRDQSGSNDQAAWYRDAVIYQLHVKAFADSDGDGIGDFDGLTQRLDYLKDLGVSAIWLLPFYPSPLRDDGYDIADYEGVHSSYGNLNSFKRFLRAAHARGLRVITELVINHTSDAHEWFQRARRAPAGSAHRNYYVWSDTPDRYPEARIIFQDFESSNWSWDAVAGQYFWHRFYAHQPDLNFDNPAVHRAVLRVLDRWLSLGVDGVRLDAVPYLYERDGTNCENLPETHDFLKKLRAHVDERFPDRMLLAEANQWPEDAVAYFGAGDECHMAFHFPVMPRLYMALQMEDRRPVVDILEQTPQIPDGAQWAMFLRNHDELTLEMVTDEERDYMVRSYAHDPQMRINLGIRRRLAPLLQNDRRKIELLNVLLFSLPGTPVLYYGDEIGMGDNVYLGDRDGVRTPMQWTADRNAGFSRANPQQLFLPVIIDPQYHYETVNVEAQRANPNSLWWWMRRLITLRNRHHVFGRGSLEFLDPDNPKVLAFIRKPQRIDDGDAILVVANLSRYAQAVELDLGAARGATPVELFGYTPFAPVGDQPYYLTLAPFGYYWFRLTTAPQPSPVERSPSLVAEVAVRDDGRLRFNSNADDVAQALADWLPSRRWFGGGSRVIRSVRIRDAVALRDGSETSNAHVLIVDVEFVHGNNESYCVPVAVVNGEEADRIEREQPGSVIARLVGRPNRTGTHALLVDGCAEPAVVHGLVRAAASTRPRRGIAGEMSGWARPLLRSVAATELPVTPVGAEQSNTSVLLDDRAILKLYRRLDEGLSPEVELGRQLATKGFPHAAPLLGALEYGRPRAMPTTLAIIHERVPNDGDAWSYALDRLTGYYEQVLARSEDQEMPPLAESLLAGTAPPDLAYHLIGTFLDSAELLGERTGEMHVALASSTEPAFACEPFTRLYQRSLFQAMSNSIGSTLRDLRTRRSRLAEGARTTIDATALHRIAPRLDALRRDKIDATRTRVHGDYHLGQVLWDGRDFVIIDFEGEPLRSVSERRIKRSPLRDVAGMLRSFDYAAQVGMRRQVERGAFESLEDASSRLGWWATFWSSWVGARFVAGYLQTVVPHSLVPADADATLLLLDLFLLEKVCYEIGYEFDHRPDWVTVPLRGLHDLAARFPEPEEASP